MIEEKHKDLMIVLCGKSASGKSSVLNQLINKYYYNNVVSDTTRLQRDNEAEGIDYHFINKDEFARRKINELYCDIRFYTTLKDNNTEIWYYGIQKQELDKKEKRFVL